MQNGGCPLGRDKETQVSSTIWLSHLQRMASVFIRFKHQEGSVHCLAIYHVIKPWDPESASGSWHHVLFLGGCEQERIGLAVNGLIYRNRTLCSYGGAHTNLLQLQKL